MNSTSSRITPSCVAFVISHYYLSGPATLITAFIAVGVWALFQYVWGLGAWVWVLRSKVRAGGVALEVRA